jgi:anti-sigma regulatory factor (Ser/Thr protein kinase)
LRLTEHALRLSCKAASARAARSFVEMVLRSEEVEDEINDVVRLAVSELVANSVVHGGTEVALRVVVGVEKLYGEVTDYDTALPTLVEATDGAAGGRGLGIVAAITSSCGVRTNGCGKTVWFEVSRPFVDTALRPMALDALPAEVRARVMAATAQASYRRAYRRRRGGASGDEYHVFALSSDRLVRMTMSVRADGSVAETNETLLNGSIRNVVPVGVDRAAVEVRAPSGRRWRVIPADVGMTLRNSLS